VHKLTDATEVDVLIVGAGPTGLVLAVELARRGVRFRLVDRSARFFGGSRADGIQPRTLEVFDDLGLADTVLAEGNTGILVRVYRGGTVVQETQPAEPMPERPDVPYPNIWFLPQFRTEELLRDLLAAFGGRVELATELVGLTQDDDGVSATLTRNGTTEQVRARYLIGADGGRSTVRNLLAIRFEGETDEGMRVLFADVRVDGLDRDHGRVWMAGESGVALMPLSGTDLFTLTALPPATGEPTLDYLQGLVTEATGRGDIRLRELTWVTVWRANARKAERFRAGRVFLAGDAAHVCPPTGGQGMNTGIQDAYNLGWKLAAVLGGAPAELLDSYEAERVPAAEAALAVSTALLDKHKRGDEDAFHRGSEVHQLGLNYRGGPLAVELRATPGGVLAGDRAPDAPCRDAAGRSVRLFDVFRGPHWTVLAFGGRSRERVSELAARVAGIGHVFSVVRPDGPTDSRTLVDDQGHAHAAYGIGTDAMLLVRPDGYLGLCAGPDSVADIEIYMRQVSPHIASRVKPQPQPRSDSSLREPSPRHRSGTTDQAFA
jgi:2-polyprenyl-6-methoxyphenol hydroxylase-like FAD-dependent oxidoreductase